jgi:predicted RNase H-related nuclease YkuK (DUF458 family)
MENGDGRGNGHPKLTEYFTSPTRGQRDFSQVVGDVTDFINEDAVSRYTVVVGTDSEQGNSPRFAAGEAGGLAEFVSVVVVHRVGKHGRYFWRRTRDIKTFDRHDRILKEASFSLDLAQRLIGELRSKLRQHLYDFEIHLDIGQNGPTKTMIQEIVGMITGSGFTAKIKPESYAANKVADRHVNGARKIYHNLSATA